MDLRNKFIVVFFYFCNRIYYSRFRLFGLPFFALYRLIVYWIMGTDLHYKTTIKDGLKVYHGIGLVVNPNARIGKNVILRHNVTIGNYIKNGIVSKCPSIGDNVEIGCGATILGDITVGDNVEIYAHAIVTADVPSNSICFSFNKIRIKNV